MNEFAFIQVSCADTKYANSKIRLKVDSIDEYYEQSEEHKTRYGFLYLKTRVCKICLTVITLGYSGDVHFVTEKPKQIDKLIHEAINGHN